MLERRLLGAVLIVGLCLLGVASLDLSAEPPSGLTLAPGETIKIIVHITSPLDTAEGAGEH